MELCVHCARMLVLLLLVCVKAKLLNIHLKNELVLQLHKCCGIVESETERRLPVKCLAAAGWNQPGQCR